LNGRGYYKINVGNLTTPGVLYHLNLNGMMTIENISSLRNLTGLTELELYNDNISDISWISSLTSLKRLTLSGNNINDISALAYLENIDMLNTDGNRDVFSLANNNITDLTPLVTAIGNDNSIGYRDLSLVNNSLEGYTVADNITALLKLHAAGLIRVRITGNHFSENEVSELINGKTVDNGDGTTTTYTGFGAGNVIN